MGTLEGVSEAIGFLRGEVAALRADVHEVKQALTIIVGEGCARGRSNTHRLDAMEPKVEAHNKLVWQVSGAAALLSSVIAVLMWFMFGAS